jgi:hypothetical protein
MPVLLIVKSKAMNTPSFGRKIWLISMSPSGNETATNSMADATYLGLAPEAASRY